MLLAMYCTFHRLVHAQTYLSFVAALISASPACCLLRHVRCTLRGTWWRRGSGTCTTCTPTPRTAAAAMEWCARPSGPRTTSSKKNKFRCVEDNCCLSGVIRRIRKIEQEQQCNWHEVRAFRAFVHACVLAFTHSRCSRMHSRTRVTASSCLGPRQARRAQSERARRRCACGGLPQRAVSGCGRAHNEQRRPSRLSKRR